MDYVLHFLRIWRKCQPMYICSVIGVNHTSSRSRLSNIWNGFVREQLHSEDLWVCRQDCNEYEMNIVNEISKARCPGDQCLQASITQVNKVTNFYILNIYTFVYNIPTTLYRPFMRFVYNKCFTISISEYSSTVSGSRRVLTRPNWVYLWS